MTLAPQFSSLNYRLSTKHATTLSVIWLQSQISHNFYDNVFLLGKYFLRTNRQAFSTLSSDNNGRYGGHFYYRLGRKSVDRNRKGYCSGAVASIILIDDDAYMKSK